MRKAIIPLLLALLLTLSGCSRIAGWVSPTESPTVRPKLSPTPAPTLDNEPAIVYRGVETDQRVISLIFEGCTDSNSMSELLAELSARSIKCAFFFSGLTATEETDTVRRIAEAGFVIGNYGTTGETNMQNKTVTENLHHFTKGQELLYEACGMTPTLFRCNSTQYTREVLQAAAAAGLTAGIEPSLYLNHRSFSGGGDATNYVQRLVRGSIISIKLGQELNAVEYGYITDTNGERPAIDPSPGISDEVDGIKLIDYDDIVSGVTWLLDALEAEGYAIVTPQDLQQYAVQLLGEPKEIDDAWTALLDFASYTLPVTTGSLVTVNTLSGTAADLSGSVFVGDSIMAGVEGYVEWMRETDPEYLSGVHFLTADHLTVESALMRVRSTSYHPEVNGVKMSVENALYTLDAKRVYLLLQCGDSKLYSGNYELANYKLLLYLIRKQNPGIEICVLSMLPHYAGSNTALTNAQVFRFNLKLCKLCLQYGIPFIDVSFGLRDESGDLRADCCIDPNTYGTHLNDAGSRLFLDSIMAHIPLPSVPRATEGVSIVATEEK